MELDAGTTALLIVIAFGLGCWLLGWLWTRAEERRVTTQRTGFVHQVGGVEHTGDGPTRPTFGHFDPPDAYTPPFHWAVEFTRAGHRAVLHESRTVSVRRTAGSTKRSTARVSHTRHVQLAAPPTPVLQLTPMRFVSRSHLKVKDTPLVQGTPADGLELYVFCHDADFARRFVTHALAAAVATPRHRPAHSLAVTFTNGTARTTPDIGRRIRPDRILATADCLADVVQSIPRAAWNHASRPDETGPQDSPSKEFRRP